MKAIKKRCIIGEISDVARDKVKEVLGENPGKYLRIVIRGVGWGAPLGIGS
jgi:hypothetical protein